MVAASEAHVEVSGEVPAGVAVSTRRRRGSEELPRGGERLGAGAARPPRRGAGEGCRTQVVKLEQIREGTLAL